MGRGKRQPRAGAVLPGRSAAEGTSPLEALTSLGLGAPSAHLEADGSGWCVNANGLGRVERDQVGWYTARVLSRAVAEAVLARADEISLLVATQGQALTESYQAMSKQGPEGALLSNMFGPRRGDAPRARVVCELLPDGSLAVSEYDFNAWAALIPA